MKTLKLSAVALAAIAFVPLALAQTNGPPEDQIARGKYLTAFGGCADCHTPKVMTEHGPAPDPTRTLAGHFATTPLPKIPPGAIGPKQWGAIINNDLTAWVGPWGVSFAANLTPDKTPASAIGRPSSSIATMRTGNGVGRPLPPMPFTAVAGLTDGDMRAVFALSRLADADRQQCRRLFHQVRRLCGNSGFGTRRACLPRPGR